MEEDTVVIPDWAWDSTIPLSEIIIATEPGSTRPGSRGGRMSDEKVEQLFATLERLEKAGTLQEFLKGASEVPREELWNSTMFPIVSEGFKKMHDFCMVELSLHLSEMEKEMAWANYYANYCKNIYDSYAANRDNIKNPEILSFMKDYEEYYMIKEKE